MCLLGAAFSATAVDPVDVTTASGTDAPADIVRLLWNNFLQCNLHEK